MTAFSTSDLVIYQDETWTITKVDAYLRVAVLFSCEGVKCEAPLEDIRPIAHPSTDWYLLTAPIKPLAGRLVEMKVPGLPGRKDKYLIPWLDWVPSDPMRAGGSIYLRSKLPPGTTLILKHANGALSKVVVKKLSTVEQMREKANPKKEEPRSRYDRLLDDE